MTLAENLAFFDRHEVTVGPIYDIAQIMADPHVRAREIVADYPDEELGAIPMHCVVPPLSATPGAIRSITRKFSRGLESAARNWRGSPPRM
jgi:crotonobetainyl-CoA:carnitine CoA-transferase CaiB-like acyl-CoA transferase